MVQGSASVNDHFYRGCTSSDCERWCKGCKATTVHRVYLVGYRSRVQVVTQCLVCNEGEGRVC